MRFEIEKAAGYKIFLDLDMTNSFHQRELDYETSRYLSVQTPWGAVRPLFMPEGIGPATAVLQQMVMDTFKDMQDFMITIFDNLLVLCHDYADAEDKLRKVIHRAYERNMVLKFSKSWLGFEQSNFFGYVVSYGKYGLSQDRKDQLSAITMPTNQKQMQRFLGAALFFTFY